MCSKNLDLTALSPFIVNHGFWNGGPVRHYIFYDRKDIHINSTQSHFISPERLPSGDLLHMLLHS